MDVSNNNPHLYTPYKEGTKVGMFSTIKHEGAFALNTAKLYLMNKVSTLFSKHIRGSEGNGFDKSTFKEWNVSKESLGIGSETQLTPYDLARGLGFSKTPNQIRQEIDAVPVRVINGYKLKGENEGEYFLNELGILNQKPVGNPDSTPLTEALKLKAGVSQGYSVGVHSMMVVRMFDQHLADRFESKNKFDGIVSKDEFRLFLMLHDIGKGYAVKEEGLFETPERKRKELQYCRDAIDQMVDKGVVNKNTGEIFKALLSDVTIGKFLKGEITLEEAIKEIKKAIKDHGLQDVIDEKKFFSLCKIFHIADAGAYKNLRQIDGLFEVNAKGRIRHAKETGQVNRRAGPKLQQLKAALEFPKNSVIP